LENTDTIYIELQKHLDKQAVGFPATKTGVELRILKELFTPEQAGVALHLSVEPKSAIQVYEEMKATDITVEKVTQLLIEMIQNGAITRRKKRTATIAFSLCRCSWALQKCMAVGLRHNSGKTFQAIWPRNSAGHITALKYRKCEPSRWKRALLSNTTSPPMTISGT
jgi:hypothetical protein